MSQSGSGGSQSFSTSVSIGVTYTQSQSQSSSSSASWGASASTSVAHGFSTTGGGGFSFFGIGASASVTSSTTNTHTHSVHRDFTAAVSSMFSTAFSTTHTTTETHTFAGADIQALWQFEWNFTAVSPATEAGTMIVKTNNFAATQNDDMSPCCLPGHFTNPLTPGNSMCVPMESNGVVLSPIPVLCSQSNNSLTAGGSPNTKESAMGAGAYIGIAVAVVVAFAVIVGAFYMHKKSNGNSSVVTNRTVENPTYQDLHENLLDGSDSP
jgi:hypothetical protein